MKRILMVLQLAALCLTAAGQMRGPDYGSLFSAPARYGYTYQEEMVQGGSEARLLTRIYLPEGEGPWPVVVTRTPYVYGGRGDNNALGREYAKRGIGYIQQDCRGKGGSEGFCRADRWRASVRGSWARWRLLSWRWRRCARFFRSRMRSGIGATVFCARSATSILAAIP